MRQAFGAALVVVVALCAGGGAVAADAMGDWTGGFALYVADGRLVYAVNRAGDAHTVTSDELVPSGDRELAFVYVPNGDGGPTLTLRCDGREIGGGPLPFRLPMVWQHGGTALRLG